VRNFEDASGEVEEDEYGDVIERPEDASKSLLEGLHTNGRPRGSLSASSNSSSSPNTISPDSTTASTGQDFPFSIDRPPPADILDEQLLTVPYSSPPKRIIDLHLRGDLVSSMSTDGSANPQLSWSTDGKHQYRQWRYDHACYVTPHPTWSCDPISHSIPRELLNLTPEEKGEPPLHSPQPT
jgi:hypothetical protein